MIAKIILVILMFYLIGNAFYQIYESHYRQATAYIVLLSVVFYLLKNSKAILFINNKASCLLYEIANGFDWVIALLIVFYIVITAVITISIRRNHASDFFTCLYFILLVVKCGFVFYNPASFYLMGVIGMIGLLVHPFIGLAARYKWKCIYHFSPYFDEINDDCTVFQLLLFIISFIVHFVTILLIFC